MKILQVSPQLPLPLDDGGRKSIYGIFKTLSQLGHEVHLICYDRKWVTNRNEIHNFGRLTTINHSVENNYIGILSNFLSSVPYNISKYYSAEMKNGVIEIIKNEQPDLIHIDHLHMVWVTDIVRSVDPRIPIILREHNLETLIMERYSDRQINPIIKWYAKIQAKKLRRYESLWTLKVDLNVMISPEDEVQLKKMNPNVKSIMIPAGFDIRLLGAGIGSQKIKGSICHIGPMDWQPNKDSLEWLLNEIFPHLLERNQNLQLFIFGKGTENISIRKEVKNNVKVMGYAENLWDELSKMEILVVPLRIGGGIRIKIIEAMGFGLPIVTTKIGCEGIEVTDDKHLLIGNSVNEISSQISRLLDSDEKKKKLVQESVAFVRKNFSWNEIGNRFVHSYNSLITKPKP